MIQIAQRLAITGILQHKSAVVAPTIIDTDLGSALYTGISPSTSVVPLPIIAVNPSFGQAIYTGLIPTTALVPPFSFIVNTNQPIISSGNPDNPWSVTYRLYNNLNVLLQTYTHYINKGLAPFVASLYNTYTHPTNIVARVEVNAQRLLESFGPSPKDRKTNTSGGVICYHDGTEYARLSFADKTPNINYVAPTEFITGSGQTIRVDIYE